MRRHAPLLVLATLLAPALAAAEPLVLREPVVVNAAAVAQTESGLVGSVATISISVAENGTGHIFMDTIPLTQVDMQGSARLAVKVAGAVTGIDVSRYDFFFVVRSNSQVIGGPSAGAIMTVGTIAALEGWPVNRSIMMTGTVNPDGSVGPVGGVPEKAAASADVGASVFLFPEGQERAVLDGRAVEMTEYCRDALRIRCVAVTDVEDAVRVVTGHEFDRPPPPGESPTNARLGAVMSRLAAELRGNASAGVASARAALDDADGVAESVRANLEDSLARANASLAEAAAAERAGRYYTTVSKAFQSSIEARYVPLVLGFFAAPDPDAFAGAALAAAERNVTASATAARRAVVADETDLQAVGVAQSRASEAAALAATARSLRDNATALGGRGSVAAYVEALYNVAYAEERARTVGMWLRIADAPELSGGEPVDADALPAAALDAVEAAEETVTYAELVLQEAGAPSLSASRARVMLNGARSDYANGAYAGAMFQALEAEVRGSLALELLGYADDVPESKVARARSNALAALAEARGAGLETVLAESYFEFAETLPDDADRLAFYGLARTTSRFVELVRGGPTEPAGSRFVGDAGIPALPAAVPGAEAWSLVLIGAAGGAALGALLAVSRRRSAPPVVPAPPARVDDPDENPWTWRPR